MPRGFKSNKSKARSAARCIRTLTYAVDNAVREGDAYEPELEAPCRRVYCECKA